MPKAGFQDPRSQLQAIRLALGKAEGRTYKNGSPKPISQDELAVRIGSHASAVKKWESENRMPERKSLIKINRVAPPELRFTLDEAAPEGMRPTQFPEIDEHQGDRLDSLVGTIIDYVLKRASPMSREEWERLRHLLALVPPKR